MVKLADQLLHTYVCWASKLTSDIYMHLTLHISSIVIVHVDCMSTAKWNQLCAFSQCMVIHVWVCNGKSVQVI